MLNNLDDLAKVKLYKKELFAKSGIYSVINLNLKNGMARASNILEVL